MDIKEFGKRTQLVRERVLGLTQSELAKELRATQGMLSRLESGIGANIDLLFRLMTYLDKKKYPAYLIFKSPFEPEVFSKQKKNVHIDNINMDEFNEKLAQLKDNAQKDYETVVLLSSMFGKK